MSSPAYVRAARVREYDVLLVAEIDGTFTVLVPDVPSVRGRGRTIGQPRANARRAIEGHLRGADDETPTVPFVTHERITVYPARTYDQHATPNPTGQN